MIKTNEIVFKGWDFVAVHFISDDNAKLFLQSHDDPSTAIIISRETADSIIKQIEDEEGKAPRLRYRSTKRKPAKKATKKGVKS